MLCVGCEVSRVSLVEDFVQQQQGMSSHIVLLLMYVVDEPLLSTCSGERAKQMLLHYHKGLVRSFVWRAKSAGTEFGYSELVTVGEEALLRSAKAWSPTGGAKFSTYAYQAINR